MFVVHLSCHNQHRFEGWYDSRDDYHLVARESLITCPLCDSEKIDRLSNISAAHKSFVAPFSSKGEPVSSEVPVEIQKAVLRILEKVRSNYAVRNKEEIKQNEGTDQQGAIRFKGPSSDFKKN